MATSETVELLDRIRAQMTRADTLIGAMKPYGSSRAELAALREMARMFRSANDSLEDRLLSAGTLVCSGCRAKEE